MERKDSKLWLAFFDKLDDLMEASKADTKLGSIVLIDFYVQRVFDIKLSEKYPSYFKSQHDR